MDEEQATLEAAKFATKFLSRNSSTIKEFWDAFQVKSKIKLKSTYHKYLESSFNHYARVKPSIFGSEPIPIYDFYIPLDVKLGNAEQIKGVDFRNLSGMLPQGLAVISGTAGGGKSMLMRHLFLCAHKTGNKVPVFVELRKANKDKAPLKSLIGDALKLFNLKLSSNYDVFVEQALARGHFVLILDGYDEVDLDHKNQLTEELLEISSKAPDCIIVLSTRPDETTQGWEGFSNFNLQHLSKPQAIEMVRSLPYDNVVKERFSVELEATLYEKHLEFVSTPLLLVIMLVTYGRSAEIPENLNEFYSQAFDALFYHHDASKEVYKRKRHCELGIQNFSKLFSAFCIRTYIQSNYEFTRSEALDHIERAKNSVGIEVINEDFLQDMQSSVCLLVQDGLSLVFSHRSFQEYFSAKFILECSPAKQGLLLEKVLDRWDQDKVIPLLLEMDRELVERELILPLMAKLLDKNEENKKLGIIRYSKYLKSMIKIFTINNPDKETPPENDKHSGRSYFTAYNYNFQQFSFLLYAMGNWTHIFPDIIPVFEKYLDENGLTSIDLENVSYKSTVIKNMAEKGGCLSLKKFQKLWDYEKQLVAKHKNPTKSLDSLLGE